MHELKQAAVSIAAVVGMAVAATAQTSAPPQAQKSWTDTIRLKGDLRYRHETIADDSRLNAQQETYTRHCHRIRARLGAEAACNDNLKAGMEVSSGQADPISGNQTLGDGFGKKEFRLSLAYLDYSFLGDNPHEVHAIAGKMRIPFLTMNDDLVWDPDASPEGVGLTAQFVDGLLTVFGNGGCFWLQERADKTDAMLYAGQAALKLTFVPEVALTVGGTYYRFEGLEGHDVIDWKGKNDAYGNSTRAGTVSGTTTNRAWANAFVPLVLFAQLDLWVAGKPVCLYGQRLVNGEADQYDQGWMCGVSLGKAKNPQTWEVGYSYAELEKDATVGFLTDSDRWGGGTDGRGHKLYGKYQLQKNLQCAITYFMDEKHIADAAKTKNYDRLQADLAVRF